MKVAIGALAEKLIVEEMAHYRQAREAGDTTAAWTALERAHVISQPYLGHHLSNHWTMLGYAFHLRDGREILGQLFRLVLAPLGALTGKIPVGNTGRSNVSAFAPMEVPDDLAPLIKDING